MRCWMSRSCHLLVRQARRSAGSGRVHPPGAQPGPGCLHGSTPRQPCSRSLLDYNSPQQSSTVPLYGKCRWWMGLLGCTLDDRRHTGKAPTLAGPVRRRNPWSLSSSSSRSVWQAVLLQQSMRVRAGRPSDKERQTTAAQLRKEPGQCPWFRKEEPSSSGPLLSLAPPGRPATATRVVISQRANRLEIVISDR
jgi:hypothetical protein